MTVMELARKNRSTRRFVEKQEISRERLLGLIETARFAPSGANLQLLRFTPVTTAEDRSALFPALRWAGYLEDWEGPEEGKRPAAYVIVHTPLEERRHVPVDTGIAAAYIVLAARESGLGSCMIMSFDEEAVRNVISSPGGYRPFLVIALGVPGEEAVVEQAAGDIRYYRDDAGVHHVPKLPLDEILTDST